MKVLETDRTRVEPKSDAYAVRTKRGAISYELQSELARVAVQAADRDPNRKLAWVNSIGIVPFAFSCGNVLGLGLTILAAACPPSIVQLVSWFEETRFR